MALNSSPEFKGVIEIELEDSNFFLFDLILYVQVNNFSVTSGRVFLS